MNMTKLKVRFGGSHNKYNSQWRELSAITDSMPIRTGIGSKFFNVICEDTAKNRESISKVGATFKVFVPIC